MNKFSNGLGRTVVAVVGTVVCGSSLMLAALGPAVAQTQSTQVAAAKLA